MHHVVYVQSMVRLRDGGVRALVMLTTTSERMASKIPEGLEIRVSDATSRRMGMRRRFIIDTHRLALLPITVEWFPDTESPSFVVGRADTHLQGAITKRYTDMLARRPPPGMVLGPKT